MLERGNLIPIVLVHPLLTFPSSIVLRLVASSSPHRTHMAQKSDTERKTSNESDDSEFSIGVSIAKFLQVELEESIRAATAEMTREAVETAMAPMASSLGPAVAKSLAIGKESLKYTFQPAALLACNAAVSSFVKEFSKLYVQKRYFAEDDDKKRREGTIPRPWEKDNKRKVKETKAGEKKDNEDRVEESREAEEDVVRPQEARSTPHALQRK